MSGLVAGEYRGCIRISARRSRCGDLCIASLCGCEPVERGRKDGQMALVKKTEAFNGKSSRGYATGRHQNPVKRPRKPPLSGLERLRRASDRILKKQHLEMLEKLAEGAKNGKLDNARFLVALAEKVQEAPEQKRVWFSMAQQFMSEPKWKGTLEEEEAEEVGNGE